MNKIVLSLVFVLCVMGSISDIAGTAYGEDIYNPGEPSEPEPSQSFLDNIVGWATDTIMGIFDMLSPAITGNWILDNWIIQPVTIILGYEALRWLPTIG